MLILRRYIKVNLCFCCFLLCSWKQTLWHILYPLASTEMMRVSRLGSCLACLEPNRVPGLVLIKCFLLNWKFLMLSPCVMVTQRRVLSLMYPISSCSRRIHMREHSEWYLHSLMLVVLFGFFFFKSKNPNLKMVHGNNCISRNCPLISKDIILHL